MPLSLKSDPGLDILVALCLSLPPSELITHVNRTNNTCQSLSTELLATVVMTYSVRETNNRCKGFVCSASRSLPVLNHPWGGRRGAGQGWGGGWELRARLQTLHACVTAGLGTRLSPPQGEAMAQQSRARSHRSRPGTREGRGSDPTYHAGRGRGRLR